MAEYLGLRYWRLIGSGSGGSKVKVKAFPRRIQDQHRKEPMPPTASGRKIGNSDFFGDGNIGPP